MQIDDHVLDLGGDSLAAMRVAALVMQATNVEVSVGALLATPTVAEMAAVVREHVGGTREGSCPGDPTGSATGAGDVAASSGLQPDERHSKLGAQATGTLAVDDRSRHVSLTLTQSRQTEKAAEGQRSHP
jgi:hypothetical protein